MADGFAQQIPSLTDLFTILGNAESSIGDLLSTFTSMDAGSATSPIAEVVNKLSELSGKLDIDVSGLAEDLPATINVVQNALPPSLLEHVESIEDTYTTARDFLQNSALAKEVQEGSDLQTIALAVIEDALGLFNTHIDDFAGNLIDSDIIEQIKNALALIDNFVADFSGHQDEFLPFLTDNLLGVAPDLLTESLDHVNSSYAVLVPLSPESLATALDPARQAIVSAITGLLTDIESLDPADINGYTAIQTRLSEVETAIQSVSSALNSLYSQLQSLIGTHPWSTIFSTYQSLLQAIDPGRLFSIDQIIDNMVSMLEDLLSKFYMMFGVDDITQRIERLSQTMLDSFKNSALGQIRSSLLDFLTQIRQAIESVPTEAVQQTVEEMLTRVKQELDSLGIEQIGDDIKDAFTSIETFITDNINETLKNNVGSTVNQVLSTVQNLPIAGISSELTDLIADLSTLIDQIETTLAGYMDTFTSFISQLDQLSFKPLSDEVIEEIDELKGRLQEINPNALSSAEKLAIKAALAFLQELELESKVINALKSAFSTLTEEMKAILNKITAVLERMLEKIGFLDSDELFKPVTDLLDHVAQLVQKLNGTVLLKPLEGQVDQFTQSLTSISPGHILDPLQAPYDSMMQHVNRLGPDLWVTPLNALYEKIDQLISYVDITPVLNELDVRQKALFADIRSKILDSLTNLNLPDPLDTFYNELRPFLESLTDAIFGDPDTELKNLSVEFRTQINIAKVFQPLDSLYNRLLDMIESVDQGVLTDTINSIRETIGVGLQLLDPQAIINHFRNGQSRLVELIPTALLGLPAHLPGIKMSFENKVADAPPEVQENIATTLAAFDNTFQLIDPALPDSPFHQLIETHNQLLDSLRLKINDLDISAVGEAYSSLRDNLDRMLPDFLWHPTPLSYQEILSGFYSMRPTAKAVRIEQALERFLQQLKPMEEVLEPAMNGFLANIREIIMLINPLSLNDAVADIYQTIRDKVRILDPEELANSLKTNFYDPLTAPLEELNPTQIKIKIDEVFDKAVTAVSQSIKDILADIVDVIDETFRTIRAEIQTIIDSLKTTIANAFDSLKGILDKFENLVFVELLERLNRVLDNLAVSFDKELDRVRNAFDAMLAAIPV
ncbi:hypothetical protein EH223_19315 [candidate division KSB1 bacterium]|nr:hypothetical protein [candidate division KSB1 bacterium]RQW00099.1 MAG: hypothetical protein EH223_19315 [candidate division KSB1 bacterium]